LSHQHQAREAKYAIAFTLQPRRLSIVSLLLMTFSIDLHDKARKRHKKSAK
jgi:hypothetical protein